MKKRTTLKPHHKWYEMQDGRKFGAHEHSCLFCKHLTDIYWDYTHGPYLFICELIKKDSDWDRIDQAFEGKCGHWESKKS